MKKSKLALFQSVISLILCISMLVGTTFAWFTDSVSSGTNMIAAGSLDIELDYLAPDGTWKPVDESTEVLNKDALWEPGYTEVAYLRITNAGTLALKYAFGIGILNETGSINAAGDAFKLSDYIEFGVVESASEITYADRIAARNALSESKLISEGYSSEYSMKNKGDVRYVALVVYMPESVGNAANYATGKTPPKIELGIELVATQEVHESDSFGTDYDANAVMPGFSFPDNVFGDKVSANVTADENNKVAADVTIQGTASNAVIPAGVQLEEGATELTLAITSMSQSDANITLGENDAVRSLDVHVQGVSADNTTPMEITIKEAAAKGLNAGNLKLYHVENGKTNQMTPVDELTAHNQFKYDPATGDITLYMATFSEVALVADTVNAWGGTYDYDWYAGKSSPYTIANADQLAAFSQIVGGMADGIDQDSFTGETVNLISNINLGDKDNANDSLIFHPIGYYYIDGDSSVNSFEGTFDGTGHTIANFYQNTWEIKGDYDGTYYKDAMGLFGYVYNGTVKNLTVSNFSSDGEFTPTGVIAAYAAGNANFTNIAIVNCNPRVYNTGNGGIIGIAGNSSGGDSITLQNITVDNSNKISALWGSWDVACGGLVGMFRGNDNGSTISFTNCHVAAQIDVYNDVCANYQYYAYRYSGMIIGSVRNNTTTEDGKSIPNMTGISASGCTVNYGDWNDYYYCEFEENTMASYSEDYQFSRVPNSEIDTTNGKDKATCIGHNHTAAEDKQAVYLPFHQLFTGYGWGINSVGLEEYGGIYIEGVSLGDQEESVVKFETKFTGEFLYRVGNQNTVSVGSLFAAIDEEKYPINDAGVYVTIDKVDENSDVSGTFNPSTTDSWTDGTIRFSGTGVVKLTIQDYDYCEPTVLYLEVVDAKNATTATSATKNNVVLLNDVGLSTIEVSGGYTLYGNGFKMTASSDVRNYSMGVGFVTLDNGTLDNVQIICPNFSHAVVYNSNISETGNQHSYDSSSQVYGNVRSAVMADGNSKITNSYVHGGRAAIFLRSGNLVVDGSTISGGATANIHAISAQSLTLRNVTLIQKPFQATVHDTSKTIMGFSGLFECDENGDSTPLILEGTLVQNAWINESYKEYAPSAASSIIDNALEKTDYLHDLNADGIRESLNLGFTYIPQTTGGSTNANVTDNRSNKGEVPYEAVDVGTTLASAKVYSYKNTEGTSEDYYIEEEYTPNTQGTTAPTISFTDTSEDRVFETKFDTSDNRWESTLTVNLDNGDYEFSFNNLLVQKHGTNLAYTVKTEDGADVDISDTISLTASGVTNYVLTVTDSDATHTVYFILIATRTSIPEPEVVDTTGGTPLLVVKSKDSDWSCAIPALEGIKIKYYTSANDSVTLDLATLTPTSTGKQNGTNNYWEYSNGYKLKVTCGYIHDTKQVYGMPVVVNNDGNKMYFTISSTNGYVSTSTTSRTVTLTYEFTDPNGKTLTFNKTWQFNYADYESGTQYSYSDFVDGTLKEASSGCVTPDTLITLADNTQVRVDSLTGDENLLVWNLQTGKYDTAPIVFVDSEQESEYEIIHLYFSDGSDVKVISEHGFFDLDLGEYVYIDAGNYADYVGHSFVAEGKISANDWEIVTLDDVVLETEVTTAWSPVTFEHLCYYTNGVLSMPGGIDGLFNIFEVDTDSMTYNAEQMQKDIENYGLFTLEDFGGLITEEAFRAFNGAYLKVAMGKGLLTWEDIAYMAERYIPLM